MLWVYTHTHHFFFSVLATEGGYISQSLAFMYYIGVDPAVLTEEIYSTSGLAMHLPGLLSKLSFLLPYVVGWKHQRIEGNSSRAILWCKAANAHFMGL